MYLQPTENHWSCDIEADNLLDKATRIWCVCLENVLSGEKVEFTSASALASWLKDSDPILVGHNFVAYDLVMLNRFWKTRIPVSKVVDTFVLSQLYNPTYPRPQGLSRKKGPHSLEAWGIRLKFPKTEHSDFSAFSPEMLEYCANDVSLTAKLFRLLTQRMRQVGFTELGCRIEHLSWHIIQNKQRRNGFPIDVQRAEALYLELRSREEELKDEIYRLWPPRLLVVGRYKQALKKDGDWTSNYLRHREQFPKLVSTDDGGYEAYDYVSFNLGSPDQRIQKLLELGWTPTQFTKKTPNGGGGNPKVDEDSLLAFAEVSDNPELKALAKWVVVNSRANMIRTWLNAINPETGCIHGKLFIASTLRYKHSAPNSANIPAVRTKKVDGEDVIQYGEAGAWTYESRDLWTCGDPKEFSLVGLDGTGIQNRCLIHGLIKTIGPEPVKDFLELSLRGDIHRHNIDVLGLANKAAAKKFYYCVPLDTLALTKTGWKKHDEVEVGDLVLTFNREKRIQEWKPVLEKVFFEDAPVIELKHRNSFNIRCTPNHRWFTQQRKVKTKWQDTPIEVKTAEELTTTQNIIVNAPLVGDEESCGYDWSSLEKYKTDWVKVVLEMSNQERRAFLAGFCIADGHTNINGSWVWGQNRGELFEAAFLASYLATDGKLYTSNRKFSAGKPFTTCIIGTKPHITTAFMTKTECPNQPVWCVRTENESWVIRQGDCITITGNTLMMGGGGERLAADQAQFGTKMTAKEGAAKKAMLVASIPGFRDLTKALEKELEITGRIRLCDGTPILVPSPHMVIPYLLQGDESRLMKQAMVYVDEEVRRHRLTDHVFKVADIHDEWQFRVRNEYVERFIQLALPCFRRAGDSFGYLLPIDGDAKVGKTWAQTH